MRITTNWGAFESRNTTARKGKTPTPKATYLVGKKANALNESALDNARRILAEERAAKEAAK
jgi:hypothetical protein